MRNLKLTLRYDGSVFHGWQFQPNCVTVEEELKKACFQILREEVKIQSCSRTDAGVHANMFCCNFKTNCERENSKIMVGLNAVLPESVAVYACDDVSDDFHARYSCKGKEYIYKIWNERQRNPFYNKYALHYPRKLDVALLDKAAKAFVGEHDFAALCSSGSSVLSTVRTVYDCSVEKENELVIFKVRGNGFLYNMVRIMVGTLLEVNDGKIPADSISDIINSKKRERSGITAPPQGLYLNRVFYEEGEIESGK